MGGGRKARGSKIVLSQENGILRKSGEGRTQPLLEVVRTKLQKNAGKRRDPNITSLNTMAEKNIKKVSPEALSKNRGRSASGVEKKLEGTLS